MTDDGALLINWSAVQEQCIGHYNVTINSNNTFIESRTTNNTNITINDLIISTNYSFFITPIDTNGREGPPSSLIQYIWNGKYYLYTHTHTTHCISYSTSSSC